MLSSWEAVDSKLFRIKEMNFENSAEYAKSLDLNDALNHFRERFYHPVINDKEVLYFTGNSLGLQPKSVKDSIQVELDDWAKLGVEGHFHGTNPWFSYHELLTPASARLVGANESEVVCMGSLTTNLHLLFASFYKPTKAKYKIISEAKMFPSDRYLLETQARHHGLDPEEVIVEISPREGEFIIREEDIVAAIDEHKDELALVFFGAVNYFTGQFFDMKRITEAAHSVGVLAGFDLAHAAGNIPMKLHDWNVDFAAWCTYKYLNSSAGNVAGLFVHDKHGDDTSINRFGGWWGHEKETRFLMENGFKPLKGAEGWQLSNAPVLGMSALKASLEIFDEAGIENLREKSVKITAYLEFVFSDVVKDFPNFGVQIITPTEAHRRGGQLSIKLLGANKEFFKALTDQGVITDFREPDVIRVAPVPLYNSFSDVYAFGKALRTVLENWGN
jgi:kynureninase